MDQDVQKIPPRWFGIACVTAILAAIVGMVGDICLLYSPQGGYMDGDYAFMAEISNARLLWGHYLGVLAIPLEAAALYPIYLALQPMGKRVAVGAVLAGMYLMFLGVAYHGGVYPMADAVRMGNGQMEAFKPFNEPLGLAFAGSFFVLMLVFTVQIVRGRTLLPKWVAAFSPLMTYGVCIGVYYVFPPLGNYLAPMGFNLSMGVFVLAFLIIPSIFAPQRLKKHDAQF